MAKPATTKASHKGMSRPSSTANRLSIAARAASIGMSLRGLYYEIKAGRGSSAIRPNGDQ
jgi:hypothetical protein